MARTFEMNEPEMVPSLGDMKRAVSFGTFALLVSTIAVVGCSDSQGEEGANANAATNASDPFALGDDPPLRVPPAPTARTISLSPSHGCVVVLGAVKCFGYDTYSELGSPYEKFGVKPPVAVPGIRDAVEVAVGAGYSCARHADGTVSCWGAQRYGALGAPANTPCGHKGSELCRSTPEKIPNLDQVVKIVAGDSRTCALRVDGTMTCWGAGRPNEDSAVKRMPFAENLVDIGFFKGACGLTTRSTIRCFSKDGAARPRPEAWFPDAPPYTGLTAVSVGMGADAPVLQRGGTLAMGATVASFGPVAHVVGAAGFGCAMLEHGAVRCWGEAVGGELGVRPSPITRGGISTVPIDDAVDVPGVKAKDLAAAPGWV